MITEMFKRVRDLSIRAVPKETIAKFISAEFQAAGYVSKGKLWVLYRNEKGLPVTQALA
jgi:hypothetical protein